MKKEHKIVERLWDVYYSLHNLDESNNTDTFGIRGQVILAIAEIKEELL